MTKHLDHQTVNAILDRRPTGKHMHVLADHPKLNDFSKLEIANRGSDATKLKMLKAHPKLETHVEMALAEKGSNEIHREMIKHPIHSQTANILAITGDDDIRTHLLHNQPPSHELFRRIAQHGNSEHKDFLIKHLGAMSGQTKNALIDGGEPHHVDAVLDHEIKQKRTERLLNIAQASSHDARTRILTDPNIERDGNFRQAQYSISHFGTDEHRDLLLQDPNITDKTKHGIAVSGNKEQAKKILSMNPDSVTRMSIKKRHGLE